MPSRLSCDLGGHRQHTLRKLSQHCIGGGNRMVRTAHRWHQSASRFTIAAKSLFGYTDPLQEPSENKDNESGCFLFSSHCVPIVSPCRGCSATATRRGTCVIAGRRLRSLSHRPSHRRRRSSAASTESYSRPSNSGRSNRRRDPGATTGNTCRRFLDGRRRWRLLVLPSRHGKSLR